MDCNVDKEAVRRDYVRGFSLRQLAAKYGVSRTTIMRWVRAGGWKPEARAKTAAENVTAPVTPCDDVTPMVTEEKLHSDDLYERLAAYTDKVLEKADQLLTLDEPLAPRDLKSLSSMLLDVRQLLGIMSPREAAEQEIRLIMLRKQAEQGERKDNEVVVRFVDTEGAEE